jgi:hypothetical protein
MRKRRMRFHPGFSPDLFLTDGGMLATSAPGVRALSLQLTCTRRHLLLYLARIVFTCSGHSLYTLS